MSRILTLNIGASKATLAEYNAGKGAPTLVQYGTADLSTADVNDPVSIGAALPTALAQIMRETGIRPGPVVIAIGGQAVFPRFAKIPATHDAAKLEQLVTYEIEQNVPFPIDEIVSDHQFTGDTPEGDRAVVIVAAKLESVRAVTDAVRGAGFKLAVVDVSPMAVLNALKFLEPSAPGCSVVLDIGAKTTGLIIAEDEKVYNRSIPVAGNTITKEIAQAFGCSNEEAEQLKVERGYVSLGGVTEDDDEVADQVSKVIRRVMTRLHAEIARSINFYRSQQGGSAPARVFLTGGSVRLPQLAEFLQETLQVEVGFLNPFARVAVGAKVNRQALESDAFTLAESAGLALRATDAAWMKINLLPPEIVNEARAMRRIPAVAAGAVCFLAALGAAWFAESRGADVAKAKTECVQTRNNALRTLETRLKAGQQKAQEAGAASDGFQKLVWGRSQALVRLQTVRAALVPGMWITAWEALAAPKDAEEAWEGAHIRVRGWKDAMAKAEADWAGKNGGKAATAGEIVKSVLQGRAAVVPDSVKVTNGPIDVKGCLVDWELEMHFAAPPSAVADATARKGKAKRK